MLRHTLVCLEGKPSGNDVLLSAVRFAAGYGAWLSGLYVRDPAPPPFLPTVDPMFPSFPSPQSLEAYKEEIEQHERKQDLLQATAYQAFYQVCRDGGVEGKLVTRTGDPREIIPAAARTADLVIAGRGAGEDSTLGSVAGSLVRHLARPVLLIGEPLRELTRVAVAYDATLGGERALSLGADVAARWRNHPVFVDLVHALAPGTADAEDPEIAKAEHYLDIYELEHATHSAAGRAADVIVEQAERVNADLLVMGAYGHSLVREVLLGSTTQSVIARWRRPILLWR